MKYCPRCDQDKDILFFSKVSYPYCKPCRADLVRIWRRKRKQNPNKYHVYLLRKRAIYYGITIEQYVQMLTMGCAICGIVKRKLDYDHDHKTNQFRGLLCQKCNHGIGMFNDDPILLQKAIDYLSGKEMAK